MMTIRNVSGYFYLALLGAVIATLCDANHVFTQTLSYPAPVYAGQAWWVFPGFFLAFSLMSVTYAWLAENLKAKVSLAASRSAGEMRSMVEALVIFVLTYLLSGFGNEHPALLSLIFYGTFLLRWAASYDRTWILLLAVVMAFGGMFAEGLLSYLGQVTYRHVDFFGVPFWLGGLYMHGALALRESMRFFIYR